MRLLYRSGGRLWGRCYCTFHSCVRSSLALLFPIPLDSGQNKPTFRLLVVGFCHRGTELLSGVLPRWPKPTAFSAGHATYGKLVSLPGCDEQLCHVCRDLMRISLGYTPRCSIFVSYETYIYFDKCHIALQRVCTSLYLLISLPIGTIIHLSKFTSL